jgi:phytoene dehydrogenase-like protein
MYFFGETDGPDLEDTMPEHVSAVPAKSHRAGLLAERTWDVVCVGSGMGSLAAGTALARAGRSVLVLEAHSQPGGLTHTFRRKQTRWGTGLHYTGWPTDYFCDFPFLWDALTGGRAPWVRLPAETDVYLRPDGRFVKRGPRQRYRDDLHAAFPGERPAIDRYLADMRRITGDYTRFMPLQSLPPLVERLGLGWYLGRKFFPADRLPLVEYMDRIGASERLREHLWFTWGNFGGVPAQTSVGAHAVPTEYMMDGLWTLARSARCAAEGFARTLAGAGGELRCGSPVSGLVFRGGTVAGVRVGGEEVRARTVISGIGARETYRLLVPDRHRPRQAGRVLGMKSSCSMFTLYLALDRRVLAECGLTGVNYWVETAPGSMRCVWEDLGGSPPWVLLSLAQRFQEDEAGDPEVLTAEVFVCITGDRFAPWGGTRVRKRGPEYADVKAGLTESVLRQLEATWPGFRRRVRYVEAATPSTIASYTRHQDGAAYGIAPVPGRYGNRALRVASGVPGLLLAGQDVCTAGVIGAFHGGLAAASAVLRRSAAALLLRHA